MLRRAAHVVQAGLLLGLQQPMLFVKGEVDERGSTALLAQLLLSGQMACSDARLLVLPVCGQLMINEIKRPSHTRLDFSRCSDAPNRPRSLQSLCDDHSLFPCVQHVDQRFAAGEGRGTQAPVLQQVTAAVTHFVEAVTCGTLEACPLPRPTQQQAAGVPPGSLSSRQPLQPSLPQQPGSLQQAASPVASNGGGLADGAAPALQAGQRPQLWQQEPAGNARPATMLQADAGLRAASQARDIAAWAPQQLHSLRSEPVAGNGRHEISWQQTRAADPNAAAPMQLDEPAAQHSDPAEQRAFSAGATQHSSSPDGQAADVAGGAAPSTDGSPSDYDSGHTGTDAEAVLQQGQSGAEMPAMLQMAAAAQWQQQQQQQHAAQLLSLTQQHSAGLMPQAEQPSSQQQPMMQLWQQEAATAAQNPLSEGLPSLQASEAMRQQQGQPAALASIGQVPLEQIWGQGALSSNVLASLLTGHQQSATSPNLRGT